MELWIRSQDKEILKKCDAVILNGLGLRIIIFGEEPEEYCLTDEKDVVLARYKTKERALEVLDEIQNKIKPQSIYKEYHNEIKDGKNKLEFELVMTPKESTIEIIEPHTIIYEMPKE